MTEIRAHRTSTCVDDATLAAFVDGRLTAEERAQVEAHLSQCEACYELMAEVTRTDEEFRLAADPVQTEPTVIERKSKPAPGRRGWKVAATGGLLAAAAAVVLFVSLRPSPLASLVEVVGNERLIAARPTGGFHYGPLRSPQRGPTTDNLPLLAELAKLREQAARTGASRDVHAWGVAQLLAGDAAGSVKTLESLQAKNAEIESDLGAAYLTMFQQRGNTEAAQSAIEALDRAVALDASLAEAWFNRALALQALGRRDAANASWDRYLQIDNRSPWSDEARRQRATSEPPSAR